MLFSLLRHIISLPTPPESPLSSLRQKIEHIAGLPLLSSQIYGDILIWSLSERRDQDLGVYVQLSKISFFFSLGSKSIILMRNLMSLATICSGNLHHLRSYTGFNSSAKLVRFHTDLIPLKAFDAKGCNLQPSSVESDAQKSSNCKPFQLKCAKIVSSANRSLKQSEFYELKSIQCYSLQQNSINKPIDWPATFLVFDIETTGFSRQNERIIEFACRDLVGGKHSTFQTFVNPEKHVPNAWVHGIQNHMVNRPDVPRFKELAPTLIQYVKSRQMVGKPIIWIAHNGRRFDVPFIISEFQRCYVEIPSDWMYLDALQLARQLVKPDGSKLPSYSLKALREYYEIPLTGPAHRAMQDVTTLCYVLQRMTFDLKLTASELMTRTFLASEVTKG